MSSSKPFLEALGHGAVWGPFMAALSFAALSSDRFARHHDGWGWGFMGTALVLLGTGSVAFVLALMDSGASQHVGADVDVHANQGSVAAGRDVHADHGSHVGNVTYVAGAAPEPSAPAPGLQFSEPACQLVPIIDGVGNLVCNAFLWRVNLENIVEGTVARRVSVQLTKSIPPLPVLPIDLHKFHDDVPPFTRSHDIRFGEPLTLDIIAAADSGSDALFLWRSDLPQNYAYVYALSEPEMQAVVGEGTAAFGLRRPFGLMITLRAVPDPPAKIVQQDYSVSMDRSASPLAVKAGSMGDYFAMARVPNFLDLFATGRESLKTVSEVARRISSTIYAMGRRIEYSAFCPSCGNPIKSGTKWCMECGEVVSERLSKLESDRQATALLAFLEQLDDDIPRLRNAYSACLDAFRRGAVLSHHDAMSESHPELPALRSAADLTGLLEETRNQIGKVQAQLLAPPEDRALLSSAVTQSVRVVDEMVTMWNGLLDGAKDLEAMVAVQS